MSKIIAISDLHGRLPSTENWPEADALIITGDICPNYSRQWAKDGAMQLNWIAQKLNPWLSSVRATHKWLMGGNHDGLEPFENEVRTLLEGEYLKDEARSLGEHALYFTPWTSDNDLGIGPDRWGYHLRDDRLRMAFDQIPEETTILCTHTPQYGVLDWELPKRKNLGSPELRDRMLALPNLRWHIFGHIHLSPDKILYTDRYTSVNAAEQMHVLEI